ncbi:E3 ubiquitin-protein ligase itt1 [Hypsizygus marmoreus]|uniref:RBR-type E3 ubiquitin transferase n=1 Tax=Hypsizygus marmoreus TaxID=39966 RepID=A0A369KD00_HYPMA|nr:E3 ubiquitin-protein ligase itt1 [Hypsizygus marmoreus]
MTQLGPNSSSECYALQRQEYEVLESIYPECMSGQIADNSLKLQIPIEFDEPQAVCIVQDDTMSTSCSSSEPDPQLNLSLSSLPPLMISMILPPSYPLSNPPYLTSIRASYLWVPQISRLQDILTNMWQPGEGILYTWIEFIRSGDFLHSLSLTSSLDVPGIRIPHPSPRVLATKFKDFEASTKSIRFTQSSYPCSICLTSLKGSKCIQLSCAHVFCRLCLENFWKLCIAEGDVGRVGCPDPECVKAGREANAEEVAWVVSVPEVERWRWLREKRNLEKDPTIIHCPMSFCQTPIPKPPGTDENSGWDRLRSCPACSFSFCAFCRRTWHGPIAPCPIAHSEKLVLDYLNLPEGSTERQTIERRFGKANVLRLVAAYEEEQANKEWLQASTMACPGCEVHVEKSLGCNHMTCAKCRQHFCYRCGTRLSAADPYTHFSTMGHPCYNKLFDFQAESDEWQPIEGFDDH